MRVCVDTPYWWSSHTGWLGSERKFHVCLGCKREFHYYKRTVRLSHTFSSGTVIPIDTKFGRKLWTRTYANAMQKRSVTFVSPNIIVWILNKRSRIVHTESSFSFKADFEMDERGGHKKVRKIWKKIMIIFLALQWCPFSYMEFDPDRAWVHAHQL